MSRIKITNASAHRHGVRMLNMNTGTYFHRELKPNQVMTIDVDQFIDLYNMTVDFESGILHFDPKTVPQDVLNMIGFETSDELDEELGIVAYSNKEIEELLKGKIGDFNKFMKEIKGLETEARVEFSKRVFSLAEKLSEEITQGKAKTIEETTGMNFDINSSFKNSK